MSLTPSSAVDFQFFFQSKHVLYSICMKTEKALWGQRAVQAGWTHSLLRELSLSLSLMRSQSPFVHVFHRFSGEKETESEVKTGLRESFLHAWHLARWWIGDVSLKFRGHGEQITPPVLVAIIPTVVSLRVNNRLQHTAFWCLFESPHRNITINQSFHGGNGVLNLFYWILICLAGTEGL